jgi:hypothetical protein
VGIVAVDLGITVLVYLEEVVRLLDAFRMAGGALVANVFGLGEEDGVVEVFLTRTYLKIVSCCRSAIREE